MLCAMVQTVSMRHVVFPQRDRGQPRRTKFGRNEGFAGAKAHTNMLLHTGMPDLAGVWVFTQLWVRLARSPPESSQAVERHGERPQLGRG
jgi:hypothetical protein